MLRDTLYQPKQIKKGAITTLSAFLLFHWGSTGSSAQSLPKPPDTGTPEEDFSAGGTRDSDRFTKCGATDQSLAYLLGDNIRDFTLSAYPTFWFYFSNNAEQVRHVKFVLIELETEKKIYERAILKPKTGVIGIALPQEQYALSENVNYVWRLEVDCADGDNESLIALEGWLTRVPSSLEIQNQLAAASDTEKYQVYLQHNLLYDALDDLAQRRITAPNNRQLEAAWEQLLAEELGWQGLIQPAVEPYLLETEVYVSED